MEIFITDHSLEKELEKEKNVNMICQIFFTCLNNFFLLNNVILNKKQNNKKTVPPLEHVVFLCKGLS